MLSVDSYLCPFTLNWLGESNRLKSDLNPVGLVPGEAAAALLLEPRSRGNVPNPKAWAHVNAVAVGVDDAKTHLQRGRGLARVLRSVLKAHVGDLYLDLNGEEWRAREYGQALVHLGTHEMNAVRLHHPAAEIGDTGAVSPFVATILAARSLQRGYARDTHVAVATSTDQGSVGALLLRQTKRSTS